MVDIPSEAEGPKVAPAPSPKNTNAIRIIGICFESVKNVIISTPIKIRENPMMTRGMTINGTENFNKGCYLFIIREI